MDWKAIGQKLAKVIVPVFMAAVLFFGYRYGQLINTIDKLAGCYNQLAEVVDGDLNVRFYGEYSSAVFCGLSESIKVAEEIIGKDDLKNLRTLVLIVGLNDLDNKKAARDIRTLKNHHGGKKILDELASMIRKVVREKHPGDNTDAILKDTAYGRFSQIVSLVDKVNATRKEFIESPISEKNKLIEEVKEIRGEIRKINPRKMKNKQMKAGTSL